MNALLSHQHSSESPRSDNDNIPAKLAKLLRKIKDKNKNLKPEGWRAEDWVWLSSFNTLDQLNFVLFFSFRVKWNLGPSPYLSEHPTQSSTIRMSHVRLRTLMALGQFKSRQIWNTALWQGVLPTTCWVWSLATLKKKKKWMGALQMHKWV